MTRQVVVFGAVLVVGFSTMSTSAQVTYQWQGGPGTLLQENYADGSNVDVKPGSGDYAFIGANGEVTENGSVALGRIRVGHNNSSLSLNGPGSLTLGAGAFVETTLGDSGVPNAGLTIGATQNGVVSVQDGAFLQVNRLVVVGNGNNVNRSGTLNVTNGGVLTVVDGNINLGDGQGTNNGVQGILNISGANTFVTVAGGGADIQLGPRSAKATYIQSDGTVTVNDSIDIGTPAGASTDTSLTISGGSITTGSIGNVENAAGNFFVGRGAAVNATFNMFGTATVNVGNRFLMGGSKGTANTAPGVAMGTVTNHTGGTLNVDVDIRVADASESEASDSTYNLSGTGIINTNMGGLPVDPNTTSSIIGRRGIGTFNQAGGTANFNSPLRIGDRDTDAASVAANGLYRINDGDLNINAPTSTFTTHAALSIGANGTGEFRVVGDDATIDVDGNFAIATTANGNGTLAFELETGDLLSQINVTGTATFGAGSILAFDTTNASPTEETYVLLTAASITDNGLIFNKPGWDFQIVDGGNGKVLELIQSATLPGDHNGDGNVDILDYVVWRANPDGNGGTPVGFDDWAENYGNPPGSGSGAAQSAAVPEPATASMILMLGLVGWCGRAAVRRR